jgi:23S rRNA pseudouridine2605 synthase
MKKFNNKTGDSSKKSWGDNKEPGKRTSYSKKKDSTDKTPVEKSEYKGRGRNQKPIFGKVEEKDKKKKTFKKPFSPIKTGKGKDEAQPIYNLKTIQKTAQTDSDEIRLNKFIANADKLIEKGEISVNGKVVKEMGYKVLRKDRVEYKGKSIRPEKPVYILLNKPKDFITTTDDPFERKTVMHLVENACEERLFPVGRLDRNTTGLLLFTNDGELSAKLTHPSYEIKKIYQVTLDKPIAKNDVDTILEGVSLEDGLTEVDDLQVLSKDRMILGIEIHSGKNRIVRRIFAHFGYDVNALDRVTFAGLSKKDIPRGKYRFLEEKEVINLKFMNKRKSKKRPI